VATPDANIIISADASGVQKAVSIAKGSLGQLQKQVTDLQSLSARVMPVLGIDALGLSAGAAVVSIGALVKAAADYGDQLDNMSQRTGIAVESLARLNHAAKLSDTTTEALGKGMTFLSGLVVSAANGTKESAALFEKYGVAVRNTDGSVRDINEVLYDLADIFAALPDGTNKTALAVEFFGKKMGAELIPLLNQGSAGLKALGDEAERLGLVIGAEQAKAAADFNDNLDRMAALSRASAVAMGSALIPAINTFLQKLVFARSNKLSIGQILFDVLPDQGATIAEQIKKVQAQLDSLNATKGNKVKQSFSGMSDADIEAEIAKQQKLMDYLRMQQKSIEGDQDAASNKRLNQQAQLAIKLQQLEKLRAIAAGEASIDILKSDKELNAARLKDAESLRDALRSAYQSSVDEAKKATDEATKLFDKAQAKRNSTADKVFDKSLNGMSEEQKAQANYDQAQNLFDQGRYWSASAGAAQLDGRLKQMEAYAKKADDFLSRAESFADKSGNTDLMTQIGEAQARAIDAQAKAKEKEAKDLEKRASDQMATLNAVEAKIEDMKKAAANFEIKADITNLESDIGKIRAEIEKGATMPIKVNVVGSPEALAAAKVNAASEVSNPTGFEIGGFTGWLGRKAVAGVVHGQEYVTPAHVTLQPGVLPFLEALRRYGNKVLPGYEQGGLVASMAMPSLSPAASMPGNSTTLVFDFGKQGRYHAEAKADAAQQIVAVFKKAALANGRR
jgi:hypothetical protein